jgi:hypothetical protein
MAMMIRVTTAAGTTTTTLDEFLAVNGDKLHEEDVEAINTTLARGETYHNPAVANGCTIEPA